jgi:hypothetical protein
MTVTPRAHSAGLFALLLVGLLAAVACTGGVSASQATDRSGPPIASGGGASSDPGTGAPGSTPACESCDPIDPTHPSVPSDPEEPVTGAPGPVEPAPADGAKRVKPEPGIVNAIPVTFDHVTVGADGRTLSIYYYGGVEDCYGLHSVDVSRNDDGSLGISILEGGRANLGDVACIEIAMLKVVDVTIDEPVFVPTDLRLQE